MSGSVMHRRIVFTSMEKFDGSSFRPLTAAEVKQIAGRAGRFGSSYGRGGITCMHQVMVVYCSECMLLPFGDLSRVRNRNDSHIVENLRRHMCRAILRVGAALVTMKSGNAVSWPVPLIGIVRAQQGAQQEDIPSPCSF